MATYIFNNNLATKLVFALLPHDPPYTLTTNRTNWKFGSTEINALVPAGCHKGVAFPILFSLMPKPVNTHTGERIAIINRYLELFGKDTIAYLTASL